MQPLISELPVRTIGAMTLALFVSVGTGCVQTSMPPARQLDAGDAVLSASVDEPGVGYIPRATGQFTYGLGRGDLTFNLGAMIRTYGGGMMGGRISRR